MSFPDWCDWSCVGKQWCAPWVMMPKRGATRTGSYLGVLLGLFSDVFGDHLVSSFRHCWRKGRQRRLFSFEPCMVRSSTINLITLRTEVTGCRLEDALDLQGSTATRLKMCVPNASSTTKYKPLAIMWHHIYTNVFLLSFPRERPLATANTASNLLKSSKVLLARNSG